MIERDLQSILHGGVVKLSTHDGKLLIQRIKSSFVQDIRL